MSPSKFESQATGSPTKFSVPNRKLRNQPANRVHDIEFAAEISTSLISQVRNLQSLLAEREEELRETKTERSRLEIEAEGIQQRLKTLDESEHRYKDENWNLETQIHELIAAQKDAADREKKLTQILNVLQAEKNSTQRELDEVKLNLAKLDEKHTASVKHHDIEMGTLKRKEIMAEGEKAAMQRKIEDLTSQNQELAKAFSAQRGRALEREAALGMSDEDFETGQEALTPEHSPPPSPVKGTPRHSVLETETLKTSLQHAQRTIQSLRTNVHREKTEKLELKRMLQEARDELEKTRNDPGMSNKRSRKVDSREFRKPPRLGQLGGARSSRSEIYPDEPDWEDQGDAGSQHSSAITSPVSRIAGDIVPITESGSDHFETANDTSDAAFETAHERGTETEDFHTGAEEFSDDDAATETEASPSKGSGRTRRPPMMSLGQAGNRYSFHSTASTSNDEEDYTFGSELKTPTALPPQRMRLRVSRGALSRRSRLPSEEPMLQSSPVSFTRSPSGTPQPPSQSLFAELGEFEGSDDESYVGGVTPSRRSLRSLTPGSTRGWTASPPPQVPALPKTIMVDSGMMAEPVDVYPATTLDDGAPAGPSRPSMVESGVMTEETGAELPLLSPQSVIFQGRPTTMESVLGPAKSHASTQWLGDDFTDEEQSRPLSTAYSDASAQHDPDMEAKLAQFPSPPTSPFKLGQIPTPLLAPPERLSMSEIQAEHIEPQAEPEIRPPTPPTFSISSMLSHEVAPVAAVAPVLAMSSLVFEHVEPVVREIPPATPPRLFLSSIISEDMEPIAAVEPPPPTPPILSVASIRAEEVEPLAEQPAERDLIVAAPPAPAPPTLSLSSVLAEHVEPILEPEVPIPSPVELSLSAIQAEAIHPVQEPLSFAPIQAEAIEPVQEPLAFSAIQAEVIQPIQEPDAPLPALSFSTLLSQQVEPVCPEEPPFVPPVLGFATVQSVESEPVEPRSPKRDAFIIPRDDYVPSQMESEPPRTPPSSRFGSVFGFNKTRGVSRAPESPIIAEDDTRQSLNGSPVADTPESQRPLKELSANTETKPARRGIVRTTDQSAQTSLTSDAIDEMLGAKYRPRDAAGHRKNDSLTGSVDTPGTVRRHRSRESLESVVRKGMMVDAGADAFPGIAPVRRPGSSASGQASSNYFPPLPANHKQAIEAARTGSSSGGQGTMGPPLFPASAYRNPNSAFRPRTPSGPKPQSPISVTSGRGTPTPRAARLGSSHGRTGVQSPSRLTNMSRRSSVSSFVSELDSRFNIQSEMGIAGASEFGPNTDPRMIQAITQTMIGEYLWKYTRKTGRGEMSENRHRRYFWVHPYTRTLYWSDRDPSSGGRSELRAKSVPIEAVRVVTDDNPMPPGLHRKSLIVVSPGRTVKFTCTTGQRHETWFNALSYLLLRTGEEGQTDTQEMMGNITREDVDEFNPQFDRRPANGTRPRAPPSMSSYNSRMTRNESPAMGMSMNIPTLTPTPKKASQTRPSFGTLSRISGYWKDSKVMSGTFSSLRSRSVSGRNHINYEASEAHDSAEDLRLMIERQDRESDRLENVRACCDGKPPTPPTFDVRILLFSFLILTSRRET